MSFSFSKLRRINIVVAGGLSAAFIVGKVLNVENVKKKYMGDKPTPIPPKIQSLIDEVCKDLKLEKSVVKPFMTDSSDIKGFGFPLISSEILLGIPGNYVYEEDDIRFNLVIDDKEIPPSKPEYNRFKQALCLSKEAKKFGIAHEIIATQQTSVLPISLLPMVIMTYCNSLSYFMERRAKDLSKKPAPVSNHIVIFLIGAWLYALVYDIFNIYKECETDMMVTDLGKSYVQAGIEFYEKMIKKNIIQKEININAPYTPDGDLNVSKLRMTHMPLKKRLNYFKDILDGKKESTWHYVVFQE